MYGKFLDFYVTRKHIICKYVLDLHFFAYQYEKLTIFWAEPPPCRIRPFVLPGLIAKKKCPGVPNLWTWKRVSWKDVSTVKISQVMCLMRNICDLACHKSCHLDVVIRFSPPSSRWVVTYLAYLPNVSFYFYFPIWGVNVLTLAWWRHSERLLYQIVWNSKCATLSFLHRELVHVIWMCILVDEFMHPYTCIHGLYLGSSME